MSMNKVQTLLAAFKKLAFEGTPPTGDAMTSYKLKNGSEISVSKLEVGGAVKSGDAAAAAGDYELEDGTVVKVGADGTISEILAPAAAADQKPAPAKFNITEAMKTPEGLRQLTEAFATGTPEERLANLEMCAKALMEYSFGWEIRKAKEEADRAAAIKVYTDQLAKAEQTIATQQQAMAAMVPLLEELANAPVTGSPEETKKEFSFSKVETKNKALDRFASALGTLKESVA